MSSNELAVAAAVIDLYEPPSGPLNANHVLRHARDFFRGQGDLVPTVEALGQASLIEVTGNNRGVFVTPRFEPETTTAAVLQGRALLEFGRLPLPRVVSSIFSAALAPRVQPSEIGVHGIGRTRLRGVAETGRVMGQSVG